MTTKGFATFEIKGVPVAAVDLASARELIYRHASQAQGTFVTVTGAHGIVESACDDRVRVAHQQAFIVVPDGMPLVWLGKLLGFRSIDRVYGPDLMECIFADERCRQLRHFFYGATPSVIDKLCTALRARFGNFNLVGAYSPSVRPLGFVEQDDVLARIRDLKPDLIWIGLSTPKQEIWMQMHTPKIGTGIAIGVGAAFDLVSGMTAQAPRWVQRAGLEWLFRLLAEPRRLFRRYLVVVPQFLCFFVAALAKHQNDVWRGLDRHNPA